MGRNNIIRSAGPFSIEPGIAYMTVADRAGNYLVVGLVPDNFPDEARERRVLIRFPTDGAADRCGAMMVGGDVDAFAEYLEKADAALGEVLLPDHPGVIVYGNPALLPPLVQDRLVSGHTLDLVPADLSPETIARLWSAPVPDERDLMQAIATEPDQPARTQVAQVSDKDTAGAPNEGKSTVPGKPRTWRNEEGTDKQRRYASRLARLNGVTDFDVDRARKGELSDFIGRYQKKKAG